MADYNSVLKKAIAGLQENTGSARRAVYQRARNAIVKQLKSYDPPLSPSQITEEQLKLEEAIRKVEAEAARASLGLSTPKAAPQAPAPTAPAAQTPPPEQPQAPKVEPQAPVPEDKPAPAGSKRDVFKEAVRAAQDLGSAAHEANQRAREQLPETPAERKEPQLDDVAPETPAAPTDPAAALPTKGVVETSAEERSWVPGEARRSKLEKRKKSAPKIDEPAKVKPKKEVRKPASSRKPVIAQRVGDAQDDEGLKPSNTSRFVLIAIVLILLIGIGFGLYSQRDMVSSLLGGGETPEAASGTASPDEPLRVAPERAPKKNTDRLLPSDEGALVAPDATKVTTTRITRSAPEASQEPAATPQVVAPTPATNEQVLPATADSTQVAAQNTSSVPPAEGITTQPTISPVAQQSILYEEAATPGAAGSAVRGNVVWSLEDESGVSVVKAVASLPARNLSVEMTLKPNTDKSLPASHLLELNFVLPDNFDGRGVQKVPGLILKSTESEPGDPLDGAAVKVSDSLFWIALSDSATGKEQNLKRLKERQWIDVPLLYASGRRAMLTFEKGPTGNKVVDQAIQSWN